MASTGPRNLAMLMVSRRQARAWNVQAPVAPFLMPPQTATNGLELHKLLGLNGLHRLHQVDRGQEGRRLRGLEGVERGCGIRLPTEEAGCRSYVRGLRKLLNRNVLFVFAQLSVRG